MPAVTTARKSHSHRMSPAQSFHLRDPGAVREALPVSRDQSPCPPAPGGPLRSKEVGSLATGPKTPEGKAVSARNSTTHGIFCRQTVLPHLGEDPQGYLALIEKLVDQLKPNNLMEMQYLELWASASWKLRRLSRLEAELWEQPGRPPAERLIEIDKLARLHSRLIRQMDKALQMLGRDVPDLIQRRAREEVLLQNGITEGECARNPHMADLIERTTRRDSRQDAIPTLDPVTLDCPEPENSESNKNVQNEPLPHQAQPLQPTATGLSPVPTGERCPMRADRGTALNLLEKDTDNREAQPGLKFRR